MTRSARPLTITQLEPRQVLTRQAGEGFSFTLNPYSGCVLGCVYCYVPRLRFMQYETRPWGSYLDIKQNVADKLDRELTRLKQPATIFMSTATDPYQPIEATAQVTRSLLPVFRRHPRHSLRLLTKSPLFLRDLELLGQLHNFALGISLSTFNDRLAKALEAWAAPPSERLTALGQAAAAGLATFVLWAPAIVPAQATQAAVQTWLAEIKAQGIRRVSLDRVNYTAQLPPLRRIGLMGERFATRADELMIEAELDRLGLTEKLPSAPAPANTTPLLPF